MGKSGKLSVPMHDKRGKASSLIRKKAKANENKLDFFVAKKSKKILPQPCNIVCFEFKKCCMLGQYRKRHQINQRVLKHHSNGERHVQWHFQANNTNNSTSFNLILGKTKKSIYIFKGTQGYAGGVGGRIKNKTKQKKSK